VKQGYLSEYFEAVAIKRLSAVEIAPASSHQHELNGTAALKSVLGVTGSGDPRRFITRFVWAGAEGESRSTHGHATWYDSRRNHPKRSEYRLYYPTTVMSELAREGDTLFVALRADGTMMMIIAAADSTVEQKLRWLFDAGQNQGNLFTSHIVSEEAELDFPVRMVLDELGIDIEEPEADQLDRWLDNFNGNISDTAVFSEFARSTLPEISVHDDPDATLVAWFDQEERLFRRLERHQISKRLSAAVVNDRETDNTGFLFASKSVQDSRKSRASHAFENHIAAVFDAHEIRYVRGLSIENSTWPNFLFPGIEEYNNRRFPETSLTTLDAITSCKDRWQLVPGRAKRIPVKHLLTIEPSISEHQTTEMNAQALQLVVPSEVAKTYLPSQQSWLINVSNFIDLLRQRDRAKMYLI